MYIHAITRQIIQKAETSALNHSSTAQVFTEVVQKATLGVLLIAPFFVCCDTCTCSGYEPQSMMCFPIYDQSSGSGDSDAKTVIGVAAAFDKIGSKS